MSDFGQRHAPNAIAHFDISGPTFDRLRSFYSEVFGWTIAVRGPGYASVKTPMGSADGALLESEEAALTIGIAVPDLARSLEDAVAQGGSIAMPATDNGWVVKAQIVDPAGNRLTLIQG
jgi:predicted enzyme related to lactoylglutathione lyase